MASHGPFQGSKRAARGARLEQKKRDGFQKRLDRITALAQGIQNEQDFQSLLAQIEDDAVRREVEKFIEPLLRFERSVLIKPEPAPFAGLVIAER